MIAFLQGGTKISNVKQTEMNEDVLAIIFVFLAFLHAQFIGLPFYIFQSVPPLLFTSLLNIVVIFISICISSCCQAHLLTQMPNDHGLPVYTICTDRNTVLQLFLII